MYSLCIYSVLNVSKFDYMYSYLTVFTARIEHIKFGKIKIKCKYRAFDFFLLKMLF